MTRGCFVKPFLPVLVLALGFCFGTVRADSLERGGRWLSRKLMERHGALEEPFVYLQKIGVKTRPKMLSYGVSNEMLLFWDSGENVGKIQRLIDDRLTALSQALADNDFADLSGEALKEAISERIRTKSDNLVGDMASQGTTPRRLTDLIGSLCDLTSGSGDKGTPVILVQGYFDNYTN